MPTLSTILGAVTILGFGMLEGYAFAAAGLAAPTAVKGQMAFTSFAMMKLFIAAVGSSMVVQSALDLSGNTFDTTRQYARKALSPSMVATGCIILGAGMYLAGSGPTMMPTQLATGISTAPYILGGAFSGGLFYALVEKYLPKNCGAPRQPLDNFKNYSAIALPMGTAMISMSFGLEKVFPSSVDFNKSLATGTAYTMLPTIAGLLIGFNQLPLRLIAGRGQGGSTPVVSIISTITGGALQAKHRITDVKSSLQTLYVYPGTFLGALLAAQLLGYKSDVSGTNVDAFIGGFLMLFGGRLADGCTCGHGITGFSELSPISMLATVCLFAGGMGAAALKLTF